MHDSLFPPRIESAFRALAYTRSIESGGAVMTPIGPQPTRPRALSAAESALRNTAAEVIRNYISGEVRIPQPRRRRGTSDTCVEQDGFEFIVGRGNAMPDDPTEPPDGLAGFESGDVEPTR